MHKQYYTLCCKNNCFKQDNAQWKNFVGCKNYTKDTRNRTCITGPMKGFVQNLKDKLNLQNENLQYQFAKKPAKKKQKDYYCLMLRKINNLDKKLQNLENLFISHLNHNPSEFFNSNGNEPFYDYMDFYESVRSLVDLANRLKEDIMYKQCENHVPSRHTLHLTDRIQVLDSELQNLYTYLEQLRNCTNEKQNYAQDCQDVGYRYSAYRGGPKIEKRRCFDFKEYRKMNNNKRNTEDCIEDCRNNCVEYCYEADVDTPISCQCSRCNVNTTICSMVPGNRRFTPKIYECCQGETTTKNSDCSCVLCINERKNMKKFRQNSLLVSQSNSSCSCEICISNKRKTHNQNCNGARIKIIKPVKKGDNEDFVGELQISYHEMEPSTTDKKRKQKNKNRTQNEETYLETTYFHDIGPESKGLNSTTTSHVKSKDNSMPEQTQERLTKNEHSKTTPSNTQFSAVKNVIYYELTPDLNIITKGKNNGRVSNSGRNKNNKKNKNKVANYKDEIKTNGTNTVNFNLREENTSDKFFQKDIRGKRNSRDYRISDQSSSDNDLNVTNLYQGDKKFPDEQNNESKTKASAGKHLHIKIRKKKEFVEGMAVEGNEIRSPERQYKYTNNHKYKNNHKYTDNYKYTNYHSQPYHRGHGGFCHFQRGKDVRDRFLNKRYPNIYPYCDEISESDSFETVEEYESDSDSSSSQYKLFFCSDVNCVEKVDSDELIMLLNKTDLSKCGGNPYKLSISENVKDLKSDVCEKCTIKEKTIEVTGNKSKNKNNNGKAKIIFKKEVVECSKCKNKKNDQFYETNVLKTNVEYVDSETENYRNKRGGTTNQSSKINGRGSNIKSSGQEDERKNKKDFKSQKSNQYLAEKGSYLQTSKIGRVSIDRKQTSNAFGSNEKPTTVLACSNLDQIPPEANNNLPGFGNLININIERGSYSLNHKPDITNTQKDNGETNFPEKKFLENKNVMSNSTPEIKHDTIIGSLNQHNVVNSTRNTQNRNKSSPHQARNKSFSAMDLEMTVKPEIIAKEIINHNRSSKLIGDMQNQYNKDEIVMYAATLNNGMHDGKDRKRLQSKMNNASNKKDKSLNYVTEDNSRNLLDNTQDINYIYEKSHGLSPNVSPKKSVAKPRVSTSKVRRSRLKYTKKYGPPVSKISSIFSTVVHPATLYSYEELPFKKSNVFNPGRRVSKLTKRKHNGYPRMHSLKENSLSGIMKPQVKIIVHENYQNDMKNPSNIHCNSGYKFASISNYLSSTVMSESSYSTLNWEKVANKLKEDDKYFNDVA